MVNLFFFVFTVLFSALQSVFSKRNTKGGGNGFVFLALRSFIACILFVLLFFILKERYETETLYFGLGYGVSLTVATFCGYSALKLGPMGPTSSIVTFSLVLPVLWSLTVFGEVPSVYGIIGLILTLPSILLIQSGKINTGSPISKLWFPATLLTLVANGIGSILQMEYRRQCPSGGNALFMLIGMGVSVVVFSLALLATRKKETSESPQKVKRSFTVVNSLVAGTGNGMMAFLTLFLSGKVSGQILFPALSVATISVALLCGLFLFHEKVPARKLIGVLLGAIAIFLLKLG